MFGFSCRLCDKALPSYRELSEAVAYCPGKAILDWLLDDINTSGVVSEYVIISNHKYVCHFEEWAKAKPYKITVVDDGTETNETRLRRSKGYSVCSKEVEYR